MVPYVAHLETPQGRDYLRIVAQLSATFSAWRTLGTGTGPRLIEILTILEGRRRRTSPRRSAGSGSSS